MTGCQDLRDKIGKPGVARMILFIPSSRLHALPCSAFSVISAMSSSAASSFPDFSISCFPVFPSSRFTGGSGSHGIVGTGPGPCPVCPSSGRGDPLPSPLPPPDPGSLDEVSSVAFPGSGSRLCSRWKLAHIRGGQPSSPGPFNLWILRVAVDRRREVVGPRRYNPGVRGEPCIGIRLYLWRKRQVCAPNRDVLSV